MKNERRNTIEGFELRDAVSGDGIVAVGYAAVFDLPTQIGGFTESVGRSAFDKTLQESDVMALFWLRMSVGFLMSWTFLILLWGVMLLCCWGVGISWGLLLAFGLLRTLGRVLIVLCMRLLCGMLVL